MRLESSSLPMSPKHITNNRGELKNTLARAFFLGNHTSTGDYSVPGFMAELTDIVQSGTSRVHPTHFDVVADLMANNPRIRRSQSTRKLGFPSFEQNESVAQ
jgi:hypothetical protein